MQYAHDLVQEKYTVLLEDLGHLDIILNFYATENNVSSITRYHNLQLAITFGHSVSNYPCTKLSKAHLKQFSDSVNCFLELDCLNLVLSFKVDLLQCKHWFLWLLKRIVCKLLDNTDHLGDWLNNDFLCVCREHQGTSGHHNACKDGSDELVLSIFDLLLSNVKSGVCN